MSYTEIVVRKIEAIPERLKLLFERMNLSPEEQQTRWMETIDRQNVRHSADEAYRAWLRANRLADERYPTQMAAACSGVEYADLGTVTIEDEALARLTLDIIQRFKVFPWKVVDAQLYVAVTSLDDPEPLEAISKAAGLEVVPVLASPQAIEYRIAKHFAA